MVPRVTNAHHEIERVWVLREVPVIPAWDGQKGVATGAAPFLVKLGQGRLRVEKSSGGSEIYLLAGGFAQMNGGVLTVLGSRSDGCVALGDGVSGGNRRSFGFHSVDCAHLVGDCACVMLTHALENTTAMRRNSHAPQRRGPLRARSTRAYASR